ncbi:hypothetical protein SAMN05720469_11574 [Fibrobacter intestinalis]|uniref:DUF4258 domain-containing protein n=1 Tax=Fibrobacter intestinalis TaxID=28122 RepID=A0A1M6UUY2_9BACT|nr:hypothetical protein [Fibrobacter intestinalis]SHK73008.1 hypothetical protein SAMN05720469_11574 [Fibrobacter intestinalis]
MNVRIGDHAIEHMTPCGITEEEVRKLFNEEITPFKVQTSDIDDSCVELYAVLNGKPCKVVYSFVTNTVVTAFSLKGKKWLKYVK